MRLVRWILVAPAAIAGWVFALFVGLLVLGFVDSLCPPEEVVSGLCGASWYPFASRAVVCFGAGLSALLVVGLAAWVAPSHREAVSWVCFGLGAAVAILFAGAAPGLLSAELVSALGGGLLGVAAAHYLQKGATRRSVGARQGPAPEPPAAPGESP